MLRRNFLKGLVAVATVPAAVYAGKKVVDDKPELRFARTESVRFIESPNAKLENITLDDIPPEIWSQKLLDKWYDEGWPNV